MKAAGLQLPQEELHAALAARTCTQVDLAIFKSAWPRCMCHNCLGHADLGTTLNAGKPL